MARGDPVLAPNLGLYLGRSPLTVPLRAVADGHNFRIKEGRLSNVNLGWQSHTALDFQNPVLLIDTFYIRGTNQKQIVATKRDIFDYDQENDSYSYLNPIYATGTVNVSAATPAVVTVATGTPQWQTNGIKAGDQIHFGSAAQRNPAAEWYTIASVDGESQLTLTTALTGGAVSGQAYTIRRVFTGADNNNWSTDVFVAPDDGAGGFDDDLWFATNGVDYVVTWDGLADEVTLHPELGFRCQRLLVYKNMMIYANLVTDGGDVLPQYFINSDIGKPLAAGDTGTGLSEQFRAHSGVDEIKELASLGDFMVVYSERHVTLTQFVGDPFVFVFRDAMVGLGLVAPRLIADFGDYHEFIAHDSQYLFDGVQVTEIGKQIWRVITRLRDPVRNHMGFAYFDEEQGELHWVIALTSDAGVGDPTAPPEISFVEHYLEEVGDRTPTPFSKRDLPFYCAGDGVVQDTITWDEITVTWAEFTARWNDSQLFAAFPIMLAGTGDGKIMHVNSAQTQDGTPYPSFVRFGRRVLGDRRMRGLLSRVYPLARAGVGQLSVITRYFDHPSGNVSRSQTDMFDLTLASGETHFVAPYRRGRYFDLEFRTDDGPWEIDGYDIDVKAGGER